ncbi:hypothetical protein TNCV_2911101 [Trichonephila clavipes]|nr:hypothetical protein TNCV_2911101 [Trichonephila clavipes]
MTPIVRYNDENVKEANVRNGGKEVKLFTSVLWKYQMNLEFHKVSSLGFGNDFKMTEMSTDITAQTAFELQRRMKTDVWQYLQKEADGLPHLTYSVSYL